MKTLSLVIALSCLGCADGTLDRGPPPGGQASATARDYFDEHVYPILMAKCAGCHLEATAIDPLGFVDGNAGEAYATVMASGVAGDLSVDAPIVRLDAHAGLGYAAAEEQVILEWLSRERNGL